MSTPKSEPGDERLLSDIRRYWNEHIHDLDITTNPVGTAAFFQELEDYRFDKLRYLPERVDFHAFQAKQLLEVGCGLGIDLVRFARAGAYVSGIDLSQNAIELAQKNFANNHLQGNLLVMNGEALEFEDERFDVVYAHGVLQYTANAHRMIEEIYRVLKPAGEAILMVYHKYSWLSVLSKLTNVELEHRDAPAYKTYSIREFKQILSPFGKVRIVPERFPVKTRLHSGLRATLYNHVFVAGFNLLPRAMVSGFGWHLMAFARKPRSQNGA